MAATLFTDGSIHVIVLTGMPEDAVQIGTGETQVEAWASLERTPIQSAGRDAGEGAALRWAHSAGWISAPETLLEYGQVEAPASSQEGAAR